MAKAPTSAAALNAPRPAARPMSNTCRFTIGQRLDRTFQLGLSRVTNDRRALSEPSCYPPAPLVRQMPGAWRSPGPRLPSDAEVQSASHLLLDLGLGQDGPHREQTAYDHVIQATSGIMASTGTEEVNP